MHELYVVPLLLGLGLQLEAHSSHSLIVLLLRHVMNALWSVLNCLQCCLHGAILPTVRSQRFALRILGGSLHLFFILSDCLLALHVDGCLTAEVPFCMIKMRGLLYPRARYAAHRSDRWSQRSNGMQASDLRHNRLALRKGWASCWLRGLTGWNPLMKACLGLLLAWFDVVCRGFFFALLGCPLIEHRAESLAYFGLLGDVTEDERVQRCSLDRAPWIHKLPAFFRIRSHVQPLKLRVRFVAIDLSL